MAERLRTDTATRRRFIMLVTSVWLAGGILMADAGTGTPTDVGRQVEEGADVLGELLESCFAGLKATGGAGALGALEGRFEPTQEAAKGLSLKIDQMLGVYGSLERVVMIGELCLAGMERYRERGYITFHTRGAALWEISAYRSEGKWLILRLRFTTEDVIDVARKYGMPLAGESCSGAMH